MLIIIKVKQFKFPVTTFSDICFEKLQNPSNWKLRNRWFNKNGDIFHYLILLLLPMPCFANNWSTSLYNVNFNIHLHFPKKFEQKWNLTNYNFGLCLHFHHHLTLSSLCNCAKVIQQLLCSAECSMQCNERRVAIMVAQFRLLAFSKSGHVSSVELKVWK